MQWEFNRDLIRVGQLALQDSACNQAERIMLFNDGMLGSELFIITNIVCHLAVGAIPCNNKPVPIGNFRNNSLAEITWTLFPLLLLLSIVNPSLGILYLSAEPENTRDFNLVTGSQWSWNWEYFSNQGHSQGSAYTCNSWELSKGESRLLETTSIMILPTATNSRVIVTSVDVIHSWSLNSLTLKMDAIPGRINGIDIYLEREGLVYGQCSELCGANHSEMSIAIGFVPGGADCGFA